jgi:hypothetical protein
VAADGRSRINVERGDAQTGRAPLRNSFRCPSENRSSHQPNQQKVDRNSWDHASERKSHRTLEQFEKDSADFAYRRQAPTSGSSWEMDAVPVVPS